MSRLATEEKIECLKNLLADPDDWISAELLRLSSQSTEEQDSALGEKESQPEASKAKHIRKQFPQP